MSQQEPSAQPKKEAEKKPGKDDVHEQRQQGQSQEGAVAPGSAEVPASRH